MKNLRLLPTGDGDIEPVDSPPYVEIWLSHKPIPQDQAVYCGRGPAVDPASTIDDCLDEDQARQCTKAMRETRLPLNSRILTLATLQHIPSGTERTEPGSNCLTSHYGIRTGEFLHHYLLNQDPKEPSHLERVQGVPLHTRQDIATACGMLPLTTLSVTITRDGYALIGGRSSGIACGSICHGMQCMPSGFATDQDLDGRPVPSPFGNIHNEYIEEVMGASGAMTAAADLMARAWDQQEKQDHIGTVLLHGLTYSDRINRGFTNIFSIASPSDKSTLLSLIAGHRLPRAQTSRTMDAPDQATETVWFDENPTGGEFSSYHFVPFTKPAIRSFIMRTSDILNNHSLAGLLMVGRDTFPHGEGWYQDTLAAIQAKLAGQTLSGSHGSTWHETSRRVRIKDGTILEFPPAFFRTEQEVRWVIYRTRTYRRAL